MAKPTTDAIHLETEEVTITHVAGPNGKIATVCVSVKDDDNLNIFLEATPFTDTVRKFIITHIQPSPEFQDVVRVFFRTQTVEEVVALEKNLLLASSFMEEDMDEDAMKELLNQMFTRVAPLVLDENNLASKVERLLEEVEAEARTVERPNLLFSLDLSLAEAHLTEILCTETQAPAFVITSEEISAYDEDGLTPQWDDFVGVVEYADREEPEYYESVGLMRQEITGQRMAYTSLSNIHRIHAETLDLLARLADGDLKAVKETFKFWNDGNRLFKHFQDPEYPLDREDARLGSIRQVARELYLVTDPRNLEPLLKNEFGPRHAEEAVEQYQEDEEFRRLLSGSGLEDVMTDVLSERYKETGFTLSNAPTREEAVAYYSTPLSRHTFPPEWAGIQHLIQLPLLSEHNWLGGDIPELSELEERGYGAPTVAMLLTVAIRWARLRHIEQHLGLEVAPVNIMLNPLSPRGNILWALQEGAALTVAGKPTLFRELLSLNLPASNKELEEDPTRLLEATVTNITHGIVHQIRGEGFSPDLVADHISGDQMVSEFVRELLTTVEATVSQLEAEQTYAEADGETLQQPCGVMQAMFNTFREQDNYSLAVAGSLGLLKAFAELVTLKTTDHEVGGEEWVAYQQDVVRSMFLTNHEG